MTAEPEDHMAVAAAGSSRLRASHADREHVIDMLKAAFVHGRVTKDEFDARVGQDLRVTDLCGTGRSHRRHPRQADRGPAAGQPGLRAGSADDEPCSQGPPMCGHCASHDDGGHLRPRWSRAPPVRASLSYGFDGCRCPDTRLTAREALPWSAGGAQHLAQGGERPSAQRLGRPGPGPTPGELIAAGRSIAGESHAAFSSARSCPRCRNEVITGPTSCALSSRTRCPPPLTVCNRADGISLAIVR